MGTNFYLHKQTTAPCPTCGHSDEEEPLHIGKSSAGWCFSLHVIPEEGINDLEDWEARWSQPSCVIRDEYGEVLTPQEMRSRITERSGKPRGAKPPEMYSSWQEFDRLNHSQEGPNGLCRHTLGRHCIKHGEGTWDCIVGEFS